MKSDIETRKNKWLIIVSSIALWFAALLNGTGIGEAYDIYNKTMAVLLFCLFYQIIFNGQFRNVKKSTAICILIMILQNLYTKFAYGQNYAEYLEVYMIPILYSLFTVDEKQMRTIGLIYGIGGGAVLIFANYTKYFAGWDGNSVSQICFFSYAVFIASMFDIKKREHQQRIIIYSCIYLVLLVTLNSRSCMLFSAFLLLCELGLIPARSTINKYSILVWLLVPLFVAIVIVLLSNAEFISTLNKWSQGHFNKNIFSGRDDLWQRGFQIWKSYPTLGIGSFVVRWHNSAVTCLVGAGSIGYIIWIYVIRDILVKACKYIEDNIIFGTVVSFLAVWLQQSVELGIISTRGNPVIFVLLGLILARTNTLRKKENEDKVNSE